MWEIALRREPDSYGILCERVYRQCAVAYTDFWDAYGCIFPEKRHKAVGKETGQTCYIGAIWLFVHHYNSSLQDNLSLHL
jgi:hypothetical protein